MPHRAIMLQSDNNEAELALRPLHEADRPALVDLWVEAWRATMPAIDFEGRRRWIEAFLQAPAHRTIVADIARMPTGFASLDGDILQQLVVAPAVAGTGVATRLLDAAKGERPAGLGLDVNQTNARAVRFYEREGFRRTGEGVNAASGLPIWTMRWP